MGRANLWVKGRPWQRNLCNSGQRNPDSPSICERRSDRIGFGDALSFSVSACLRALLSSKYTSFCIWLDLCWSTFFLLQHRRHGDFFWSFGVDSDAGRGPRSDTQRLACGNYKRDGIILRSIGSAGGADILSVILLNRFSVRIGTTILVFNSSVLIAAAIFSSLESALYTLIYLYVSSYILDMVITGLSQRKAVFIISLHWEEISREILQKIGRGVTIIRGQGGYSQQKE